MVSSHSSPIRVEIPFLPPRETNPNWRGHWTVKAKSTQEYRNAAKTYALQASHFSRPALTRARVTITIIIPSRKFIRDTDNGLASVKPAIDGCIDAQIIQDDDPEHLAYNLPVQYEIDRNRAPLTVLKFEEVPKDGSVPDQR